MTPDRHWQCVHCGEVTNAPTEPKASLWCDDNLPQDAGHEWEEVDPPKDWE